MATVYFFTFVAIVAAIGFALTVISDRRKERKAGV